MQLKKKNQHWNLVITEACSQLGDMLKIQGGPKKTMEIETSLKNQVLTFHLSNLKKVWKKKNVKL